MNRASLWLAIFSFAFLTFLSGVTKLWAAGSGGGFSGEVLWQIISFILLLILLTLFLKKPLRSFLKQRQEGIKDSLDQAAKKETASRDLLGEWEKKLNSLNQEVADLKERLSREGERERQRIIERAEEEGERIRRQAQMVCEQELKKARAALKKEMIDLSLELAAKVLQETIQPKDQERLAKEFIRKVGELR